MYNIIGYKYIIQWYTVLKSCTPKKKKKLYYIYSCSFTIPCIVKYILIA